jgi:hypothetical protein
MIASVTITADAQVAVAAKGTAQGACAYLNLYEVKHNGAGDLGFFAAGSTFACPGGATSDLCCAGLAAGKHVLLAVVEGMQVGTLDLLAESGAAHLESGLSGPATWEHLAHTSVQGSRYAYASAQHALDQPAWAVFSLPDSAIASKTWSQPAGGARHNTTLQGSTPLGHSVAAGAWAFGMEAFDTAAPEARLALLKGAGAFSAW